MSALLHLREISITTAAVLGVLFSLTKSFQPLPDDLYRYDLKEPFNLKKGWLLWAGIGLVGALGAIALTGVVLSFSGDNPQRETDALVRLLPLIGSSQLVFNATTCLARTKTRLGSSKLMTTQYTFSGILSNQAKYNPDFFNWNRVKIRYCDGSSFTGDVEAVDPKAKVYYRGARLWRAIMDDLLAKGMKNADTALFAGCSAGGLGAILQCDNFRALLPSGAKVKCLSDAGFFINAKDISGASYTQQVFADVVTTHQSAKNLPPSCTSKFDPKLCLFPEYAARGIQTPLFLLNAAYDAWQIKNTLAPGVADRHGTWRDCKADINKCSDSQIQTMHGFRKDFLAALSSLGNSPSRGWYINSCYSHCQSGTQETWLRNDSPLLDNTSISKAVGDWFYDRKSFQKIDCPYPCDKTCHNRVYE